ncbi:hypothetical protein KGD83_20290 [Nocardiopsis akebiae]|uniref:Uncharacterized protein n=1 Tax=Nocardiopsis akebiae TaxID=2831968 RepID=A0ABX8C0B8_9ACTN|nr:hypothetical protein [Nocardiopsis akebiae]QUX27627.1 hypothetical protein KGD83_20290 [Nocardiopsis akebiae]
MRSAPLHHHEPAAPDGGAEASDRYAFDGPPTARWSVDVRPVTGFEE